VITAVYVFVVFALALFPFMILLTWNIGSASADDLDVGLSGFGSMLIWLNFCVALVLASIERGAPWWSWVAVVVVMPFYLFAGWSVPQLIKDGGPDRWMTGILVLDAILVMAYLAVLVNPGVRGLMPEKQAAAILWAAIFALSLIPVSKNFRITDTERAQRRVAARERPAKENVAKLERLPADASVGDLIEFLSFEETSDQAARRIRATPDKEAQLAKLVNEGNETAFAWLASFIAEPTPAVCDCIRDHLRGLTAEAKRTNGTSISFDDRRILPTLKLAANNRCPILDELSAYIAIMRQYYPKAQNTYEPFDEIIRALREP
jgi:hypothetical protein